MINAETAAFRDFQMSSPFKNVTCPFCALHCDDLVVDLEAQDLRVVEHGCPKATAGFERKVEPISAQIEGQPVSPDEAIKRAATILRSSQKPLYAGLATDVEGTRAVMAIADQTRGIVDHMNTAGMMRNMRAVQSQGWIATTMGEVKNRADLLVFVGTDGGNFPRLFERVVWNEEAMFLSKPQEREIIFVGNGLMPPERGRVTQIKCETSNLPVVANALRSLVHGNDLTARSVGGVKVADLKALADRMRAARYGVVFWEPAKLDFPHADLTIRTVCDIIGDLNQTTRFAGFPLVGNEGGQSAQSVCAWQSGYPLRVSFQSGHPEYDPIGNGASTLLENGEVDALVWISSITAGRTPPLTQVPTIVLAEPGMTFSKPPDVYIPVGTPGLDHVGRMIRCDNVVSVPMRKLRKLDYPSVAEALLSIQQELG
jgi:formylmethanofuran dehydrogenase subunit B